MANLKSEIAGLSSVKDDVRQEIGQIISQTAINESNMAKNELELETLI